MTTPTQAPAPSDTPAGGSEPVAHLAVAIVGNGFSGLGTAIRLRRAGEDDFLIFERHDDVGGTWRDNSYPGCACDVPSHLYSFSFAPNPDWSRSFSAQPEIHAYLQRVSAEYDIDRFTRHRHEVLDATWDDDAQHWVVTTSQGVWTADVLVLGSGALSDPSFPDVPGLDSFEGPVFHSATWRHDLDLRGRRVAVIGTGASAIQFVPEIAPVVGALKVFQRTPPWIMPRGDRAITRLEKLLFRFVPPAQRVVRESIYWAREAFVFGFKDPQRMAKAAKIAERHMRRQVSDPDLREKITPSYSMGCKRILLSNDYLPALDGDNVEVITEKIVEIQPHAVVTADGTEHEVDTIIAGTGFAVGDLPISHRVHGRDGRTMADHWDGSPHAHNGTMIAGFPNVFTLLGPNTGLGHNSVVFMIESQINLVMDTLRHMRTHGVGAVEPTRAAQDAFVAEMQRKTEGTVWVDGGCSSWYLDKHGNNSALWPTFTMPFRRRVKHFRPEEHVLTPVTAARTAR
ncbi:flavin-containing monooxygenase [Actinomycetospora sp. CA-101289]|uniref:flavin-containing monooxygenase n=1 Tax=Actinomycetospora sp. CA-101289 TaxID=3239893 RepID=UPI003D99FA71